MAATPTTTTVDVLYDLAAELAATGAADPEATLIAAAGSDLEALEAARDRYALRLHGRSDDWAATAALRVLNRALSRARPVNPLDWKVRWSKRRKP